jgi:hypothetical protein
VAYEHITGRIAFTQEGESNGSFLFTCQSTRQRTLRHHHVDIGRDLLSGNHLHGCEENQNPATHHLPQLNFLLKLPDATGEISFLYMSNCCTTNTLTASSCPIFLLFAQQQDGASSSCTIFWKISKMVHRLGITKILFHWHMGCIDCLFVVKSFEDGSSSWNCKILFQWHMLCIDCLSVYLVLF